MAKLTEAQAKLFEGKNFGALATNREDGTPNLTKYLDADKYPFMQSGERRVKVILKPERIVQHEGGDTLIEKAKARLAKRGLSY